MSLLRPRPTPGRRRRRPLLALAVVLAAAVPLGACQMNADLRPPEERQQVEVERRTFQADVSLAEARAGTLPPVFEQEFRRRGQGPLQILVPPGPEGREAGRRLARALDKRLIRSTTEVSRGLYDIVVVSYEAAVALVPECGDWSDGSSLNPSRAPERDFGCSYYRNIGLMLSDPEDLYEGAPLPPLQAPRPAGVVEAYREGLPTATRTPSGEMSGVTAAGGL